METAMESQVKRYDALSDLLQYPQPGYLQAVQQAAGEFVHTKAQPFLLGFRERVFGMALSDLEELYTRTFDINPVCALEVGWHLYGESYTRGSFLVELRKLMRQLCVEETAELPDHLMLVLRILGRMKTEEARHLVRERILPAVRKMREGIPEVEHPYRLVLAAIIGVLEDDFLMPGEGTAS